MRVLASYINLPDPQAMETDYEDFLRTQKSSMQSTLVEKIEPPVVMDWDCNSTKRHGMLLVTIYDQY
jgi:hypothetical protein